MAHFDQQSMLLLPILAVVFAAVIYFVVQSQVFAACALLTAFLLSEGIRDSFDLSTAVSGFRVSALDALCAVLLGVGMYRVLVRGVRSFACGLTVALLGLLVFHVTRGTLDFNLQEAINASRTWIYFTAALVFAATAPKPWDRRVWQFVASTGIALAFISIPYFLVDGLRTSSQYVYRNGELLTARPIQAAGALVVLQAAILLPALGWPSREKSTALAGVMIVVAVLVQHRTVWAAGLAVAVIGFIRWSRSRLRDAESLVFGATGLLFIALPILAYGFLRSGALVQSAAETASSRSTFTWRTTGWSELILSHHSLSDIAAGGPAGASWARQVLGSTVTLPPHNAYLEAFLRFGLPGLTLFLGLWGVIWKKTEDVARHVGLTSTAIVLLLTSQALYGVAYPLGAIQGLIFGVFISGLTFWREEVATAGQLRLLHSGAGVPAERPTGISPGSTA
jgi:hypothetical protein